ncbi:MaoC family dehydratase [Sphingopyxis sp. YF1]|uniref:MaoC family dehydratase N-terminal domain-containing protein n=1 Tax=unclassified Sphingopyxis TaxID=2614943 RepID=UPI0006C3301E|nr:MULTISPECIES: MaoC family dehydratase N-terminal domain-containing protein [unclassified Sphingopyxis]UNU44618.1 MaoC family dehydratase [Sphingopyxis sp. YF1]USI76644.1 MaoC family dehydratase N-terminal domain-containing protein [Sphingopyxis sp. USTB-05]GAO80966.1 acyl dehydratase [Sphingopyxis sp. C-1]
MVDLSVIGRTWPKRTIVAEEGALRFFAKATGETNPVYSDVSAAKAAGHPGLPLPPTYLFTLDLLAPSETFWLDDLKVPLAKVLHAEQSFEYRRMAYAGEELTIETKISDAYDRKGGLLEFIVRDMTVTDTKGDECALLKTTLVVRHG